MNLPEIGTWVRRQLLTRSSDGPCVRFVLSHLGATGRLGVTVCTTEIPEDAEVTDSAIDQLVYALTNRASEDAGNIGGKHRYTLLAYRKTKPDRVYDRKNFMVDGGAGPADGTSLEEEAASGGTELHTQLMRHNEALGARLVEMAGRTVTVQANMIAQMEARLNHMGDQHLKLVHLYETLLSQRHDRELATKSAEASLRHREELIASLRVLFPLVANKLLGRAVFPVSGTHPMEEMIGSFMESIQPEQFPLLEKAFNPAQWAMILELYQGRMKQLEERKAAEGEKYRPQIEAVAGADAHAGNGQPS